MTLGPHNDVGDLIAVQVATLFETTATGRILYDNAPDRSAGPRLYLVQRPASFDTYPTARAEAESRRHNRPWNLRDAVLSRLRLGQRSAYAMTWASGPHA